MYGQIEKQAILQAVSAIGIFRVPLERDGYILDKGCIFILEDDFVAGQMQEAMIRMWHAKKVDTKKDIEELCNYEIGVHCYRKYDSVSIIEKFLNEKKFFPILLVAGVLPEDLIEKGYAFYFGDSVERIFDMSEEYKKMKELTKQLDMVENVIQRVKNGELFQRYNRKDKYAWCMKVLIATSEIWGLIYKQEFEEAAVRNWKDQYCKTLTEQLDRMDDLYDIADVEEMVKRYIFLYLQRRKTLRFVDAHEAVCEMHNSLLYDEEAVYFPEKMLKEACEPAKESVSFAQLKREMEIAGMLICNASKKRNFTVKKNIFDEEKAMVVRVRLVKIKRDKLRLPDGMDIIKYFEMMEENSYENRGI